MTFKLPHEVILTKQMKDFYTKNFKTLKKGIEKDQKKENSPMLMDQN